MHHMSVHSIRHEISTEFIRSQSNTVIRKVYTIQPIAFQISPVFKRVPRLRNYSVHAIVAVKSSSITAEVLCLKMANSLRMH